MSYPRYVELYPDKAYRDLTPKQAKEVYAEFIANIPYRLKVLQDFFEQYKIKLDFSRKSLEQIENVFWDIAKPDPIEKTVAGSPIPDDQTRSILMDLNIYISETLMHNYPQLEWKLDLSKGKTMAFRHEPVIVGFEPKKRYGISLISNMAFAPTAFFMGKVYQKEFLTKPYDIWSKQVEEQNQYYEGLKKKQDNK